MPALQIFTNVPSAKFPSDILQKLSKAVNKATGKPEGYIQVHISGDQLMCMGGDDKTPMATGVLGSIQTLNGDKCSSEVMGVLQSELGIGSDRVYIVLRDLKGKEVCFNSSTF